MPYHFALTADHEAMSRHAADRIVSAVAAKPNLLLCAAGGGTPLRAYELAAQERAKNSNAFGQVRLLKLDEWGGLGEDDPGTCEQQMQSLLLKPLGIDRARYFGFRSSTADPGDECRRVRERLAAEGPIDLCILGLGVNGHVGMNEPAPVLQPFAHVAHLSETSLRHPMLAKARKRPAYGLTLGMADLLASRQILLLVSGAAKREPLARLARREVSTDFPASLLWLHPNWVLICDRAAGEGLSL